MTVIGQAGNDVLNHGSRNQKVNNTIDERESPKQPQLRLNGNLRTDDYRSISPGKSSQKRIHGISKLAENTRIGKGALGQNQANYVSDGSTIPKSYAAEMSKNRQRYKGPDVTKEADAFNLSSQ